MTDWPGHTLPNYSADARDDALFHYTTANGLIGILSNRQMWHSAYFCANDESELTTGKGVLTSVFARKNAELIRSSDPRVKIFARRGVHIEQYAEGFERLITATALNVLCAYITCFCKPIAQEDFLHGLLSQWRGYGLDGGYAIQFSRKKLESAIGIASKSEHLNFDLQDLHYELNNPFKELLLKHQDQFLSAYSDHLDQIARPIDDDSSDWNPLVGLLKGPLEALLNYLVHTKNSHFAEERECRLSIVQVLKPIPQQLDVRYYSRSGLVIPYITAPQSRFNAIDAIDWIIVGPGPRMGSRFKAAVHLVQTNGLNIKVRCSHIPFTRL